MDRIGPRTASQPLAILSDLHGHLDALEAVLGELKRKAVVDVLVAGDLLLGGDQPLEVWQRLQRIGARCARGPSDIALCTVDPETLHPQDEQAAGAAQRFTATRAALGEVVLRRLSTLPESLRLPLPDGGELLVVHGSPRDPFREISHDLDEEQLLALLDDDPADIVACGATHVPFERVVDRQRVVNVGSVGEAPEGRIAHYTILYPRVSGAQIEQSWVEY